jgi:hypothetical protein
LEYNTDSLTKKSGHDNRSRKRGTAKKAGARHNGEHGYNKNLNKPGNVDRRIHTVAIMSPLADTRPCRMSQKSRPRAGASNRPHLGRRQPRRLLFAQRSPGRG